jgi:hypothetical protein
MAQFEYGEKVCEIFVFECYSSKHVCLFKKIEEGLVR